jgi:hypothetical protein
MLRNLTERESVCKTALCRFNSGPQLHFVYFFVSLDHNVIKNTTMKKMTKKNGPGDKKKKPASKKNDTISPYYASKKYGSQLEKTTAKKSMSGYFSGKSPANKKNESEGQHMARMAKRDTIPSARKSRGSYKASAFGGGVPKKTTKKKY